MPSVGQYLVAFARALLALLHAWLGALRPLPKRRLKVQTKGVDKQLLASTRGQLRAFVDGSVLATGSCGFAVFYSDSHPLNHHGSFDAGAHPAESNLTELAALYWALRHHPRGQQLAIFSDSAHALRVVQALADEESAPQPRKRGRASSTPTQPKTSVSPRGAVSIACNARALRSSV